MVISAGLYTLLAEAVACAVGYAEAGKVPTGKTLADLRSALAVGQARAPR